MNIKPLCIEDRSYYLELNGMYLPCCHLATCMESMAKLRDLYKEDYSKLFVQNNSPEDIVELWDKIADTWSSEAPLRICKFTCSDSNWKEVMVKRFFAVDFLCSHLARVTRMVARFKTLFQKCGKKMLLWFAL